MSQAFAEAVNNRLQPLTSMTATLLFTMVLMQSCRAQVHHKGSTHMGTHAWPCSGSCTLAHTARCRKWYKHTSET